MKKIIKVLLVIVSAFCIILSMVACGNGANILTDVTLEDNFSGSRVMEVSIAKSTLRDYFSGTIEELKTLINASCPRQLTYEVNETDSSLVCVFSLEFDSIETYKNKVATILDENREITVLKADTFLSQGISYQENFASVELLEWFSTALVDNNYVDSSYKNEIFESDTTTFIFSSKKYQSYEQIRVSDIQYLPFGNIDILSKPYYDNTYDRIIVFHIPQSTMNQKSEEIIAYLEEGVPSNATMVWDTDNDSGDTVFTINLKRSNLNEINTAMKSIFHSDIASIESMPYSDKTNMLEHGQALKEVIDVTNFISNEYAKAHVRYFISSFTQPVVKELNSNGVTTSVSSCWNEDYEGYKCLVDWDIDHITLIVNTKISYVPDLVNITTQVKGSDKIIRNIDLIYNNTIEDEEALQLQNSVNKAIEGYAELEYATQDNGYIISLEQSGTKEEVNQGFQTIFNTPNSFVRYAKQGKKSSFSLTSVFEEHIYFDYLFGSNSNNIKINYEAKLNNGENISKSTIASYADDNSIAIKNNIFSMSSENGIINCSVVASKFNIYSMLLLLLFLIFAVALAIAGYMCYLKIRESGTYIKDSVKKGSAFFLDKVNHILNKKQCTECKAYIDKNVKYCTKCGAKLGENENI